MAAGTPSDASQPTTKTSFTIPSFLQAMVISAMLYAALTLVIASTIPSPSPVGRLVGFWGGTTGSTWLLFLLQFSTTDPYDGRVVLWILYVLQMIIGATMVPEQYRAQVDPRYLSNVPVIIPLAAVLALQGHAIDQLYSMATKQSETRDDDDDNILPVLRDWMANILARYHGNPNPQTPPGTSTERFSMQRLDAEGSGGNFQSWLFRMVERMYQRRGLQRRESETDVLLSDMEVV